MSYTPPTGTVDASWFGAGKYAAPKTILYGEWQQAIRILPIGQHPPQVPAPTATIQQFAAPTGWCSSTAPSAPLITSDWQYRPPFFELNASWHGVLAYSAPIAWLNVAWTRSTALTNQFVFVDGIKATAFGALFAIWTQELHLSGFSDSDFGRPTVLPPPVNASWFGAATYTPETLERWGRWAPLTSATGSHIYPNPVAPSALGVPFLIYARLIAPAGLVATDVSIGANVVNSSRQIVAQGFNASSIGTAAIWNWRQYQQMKGYSADRFGTAYVQGGVKYVEPTGFTSIFGAALVVNTTASQSIKPPSIMAVPLGMANVSPRTLWPLGIYGTTSGFPVVQFPPQPLGWQSSTFGYATVEYKTRYLLPSSIDSYATGYAVLRDRAQKIYHRAADTTSVFGDVALRITTQRVRVAGWYSLETSSYAEVRSNRRSVAVPSIAPKLALGDPAVHNKTPSLIPSGLEATSLGSHLVAHAVRYIIPAGVGPVFNYFPAPSLWQTPALRPSSIPAPAIPLHTVWPAIREVIGVGKNHEKFGNVAVGFRYRRIRLETLGIDGVLCDSPRIEHIDRKLSPLGTTYLHFGQPWVSSGERLLAPKGIPEVNMHRHAIAGTRYLGPKGYEATRWLTRIVPEAREVYPKTFGANYGWPTVQHYTRYLRPAGITTYPEASMHWGVARLWNRRQIIQQEYDHESALLPPPWPKWMLIENRDKTIGGIGFVATRMTGPTMENGARPLLVRGIDCPALPEFYKVGSVTHRIRPLPIEGIEPPIMSRWAVVYNNAAPILPTGLVATKFGTAEIVNTRRHYKLQGADSFASGHPFIAYRIRELTFESRYGIEPPRISALHKVALYTRYLEPPSLPEGSVGNAALEIFFRRITSRWVYTNRFGSPTLHNVTPELGQRGRVTEEWGNAFVRLEWRPVDAEGRNTQLFGRTRIADRKQTIAVAGANYMAVGDKVTVRRMGLDPVVTQYIDLRVFIVKGPGDVKESDTGHGIPFPYPFMGTPDLTNGYIFHSSLGRDGDMQEFGNPYVMANSIRVEPGYGELLVGEPYVSLKIRQIDVPTMGKQVVDSTEVSDGSLGSWGMPRISPHTIYVGPPKGDPVNTGARFGQWLSVTKYLGTVQPVGIGVPSRHFGVGIPELCNKRQYVTPDGFNMQRLGWAVIPGPQTIVMETPEEEIADEWKVLFGTTKVAPPPYTGPLYLRPIGLAPALIPRHTINSFHRTLNPTGFFAQEMGDSGDGSSPRYMPQHLYVGFRLPFIPDSIYASSYGTAWVSLAVRELGVKGFNSCAITYDPEKFDQRMRVKSANSSVRATQTVSTRGHQSSVCGWYEVRPMRHFIRPDGNSDQYRKGVPTT